jgi:hypothetical protein
LVGDLLLSEKDVELQEEEGGEDCMMGVMVVPGVLDEQDKEDSRLVSVLVANG